jgi:glycine rich protein
MRIILARPKRNVRCIAFVATGALVSAMVAAGIPVKRHPIEPWQYISPEVSIGKSKLWELLNDDRFKFIATVTLLVTPTGSNQTFNVPGNWDSGNNKVETIPGGGSGGVTVANVACSDSGGGGGAYSAQTNIALVPGGTATYQIGAGGALVSSTSSLGINGNPGGNSWFNASSYGAASVGAQGGAGGNAANNLATAAGALGGQASSGIGSTKFSGGNSGACTPSFASASGGGGAAGPSGNGVSSSAASNSVTNGGNANNNAGATGGAGGAPTGSSGGSGTEYDASHGIGAGGGGAISSGTNQVTVAGSGGNYGGGGGGAANFASSPTSTSSGAGIQGLIVVTNIPATMARLMSNVIGA